MTTRASFGDFARAARAHLDQAAADDERAARPWQAAVLAQQSRELVWSLRAATDAMARYLADINAPFEAIFDRHPRQLPPWAQAGFVAHSALTQATGLLDDVQQSYGEPIRRPASWTAGHVHAAASAMRYGRDLLNTHFGFSPEGDRAGRSEWAPVIASAPVTRAVMLEVGLWARQTAQIGASAALSARAQVGRSTPGATSTPPASGYGPPAPPCTTHATWYPSPPPTSPCCTPSRSTRSGAGEPQWRA